MALTQALLNKLSPFGLCINSRAASTMCNVLVLSVECRLPAAFHMQCPARLHDPRMVLMKAQWWFALPFTYMYTHIINCTVPNFFLSSQFRHKIFVSPETRNHANLIFRDLGLLGNKPLHHIIHLPESKRIILPNGYRCYKYSRWKICYFFFGLDTGKQAIKWSINTQYRPICVWFLSFGTFCNSLSSKLLVSS